MGQHGFARDMEFAVDVQTATEAWFSLRSNEETKAKYPFEFILKVGYELEGKDLKVIWQVENPDTKTLYFPSADTRHLCVLWMEKESSRNIISSLIRTKI